MCSLFDFSFHIFQTNKVGWPYISIRVILVLFTTPNIHIPTAQFIKKVKLDRNLLKL